MQISSVHLQLKDRSKPSVLASRPRPWLLRLGLRRLDPTQALHDSLDDLFQLPKSHHSLRVGPTGSTTFLETSLLFVDAYGSFRSALVGLKEAQLAAQVAIRCRDGSKISSCVKSEEEDRERRWRGSKRNKMDGDDGLCEFQDAWGENLRRWKDDEKMELRRLKVCEEWVVEIEKESERLFKSLINARVSLLNVLTQLN
ncbi:hypothetical protein CKAN_02162200 [Cinnamomum micranthum f. kanehirae]|uniref:Uncharacterized protein n=1 Tax=Cinnamomum micranthum f. kanehirae TaxID=337451 RepID=A0A3S3NCH9_9MAGN|nr:hypothetical protein CKAN_02162200 [Cinnamomum micranthum f. kanehirae]